MPKSPEQFRIQGDILPEQTFNAIADECENEEVVNAAIASLKRKGRDRAAQFIEAESNV